ncbi:hypothetical protein GALMADRAFT_226651 [Galerina marginata CBS 339.88]|uniref:Transmembrane protein n=1 Tax=Galerina marginata (strain CBS 339.88) TaxID=685588 RepID=A0A067T7Q4_GALM3|nr:hypothetical protein GALMADRAFT_226651 [Galerina marginata CBS 339.88]
MPTLSTTIEDTAPVLIYSGSGGGDWFAGTSRNDSFADQYSQSSFMVTQNLRADVSFSFYGTGVQIYGAKRPNHGYYQISIDSTVYPQVNGAVTDDPGTFQTALFSAVALKNGYHTVRMTNLGTAFLDIDFLTWQTPVGKSDEPLLSITSQDSDDSFKYTPASAWNPSPPNVGMFSGGSGHITTTAGACVEYTFSVSAAVALFGPVGPSGAPYSVQLDGGAPANYSAYKQFYRPQQVLYQAANLGSGKHTVRMVSEAWNNSALTLAIDYAEVFTTPSLQRLSAGAIAAISIGSTLLFLLLAIAAFVIISRRLIPPKYGAWLRLKGKSERSPVPEAFEYRRISVVDSTSTHPHSGATYGQLTPQVSYSTLHATPPSTGLLPSSGGTYATSTQDLLAPDRYGPNTQVITIPFTADGKYRPDLPATPVLLPPPQGVRRTSSLGPQQQQQQQEIRSSRSHGQLVQLPPGAAQPDTVEIWTGTRLDDSLSVPMQQRRQAVLAPVRRPGLGGLMGRHNSSNLNTTMGAPPRYELDPS